MRIILLWCMDSQIVARGLSIHSTKAGVWQRAAWRAETSGLGEIGSGNGSASDLIKSRLQDGKRSLDSWGGVLKMVSMVTMRPYHTAQGTLLDALW